MVLAGEAQEIKFFRFKKPDNTVAAGGGELSGTRRKNGAESAFPQAHGFFGMRIGGRARFLGVHPAITRRALRQQGNRQETE
jgi:hypothetical protein